jgi:AraC-like DNA-binding protein
LKKNLEDIGIQTLAPPLALSARLALKGRLGDADALAASGFDAVQTLLDETLLSRSAELKERALRRRFAAVVGTLETAVQRRADAARERETVQQRDRAAGRQLAAQIEVELEELAPALVALVGSAFAAWQRDVSTALIGRDRVQAEKDPAHARYVVDRALVYLAPALAQATPSLATGVLPLGYETLASMARAVVRTYAPQGMSAPLLPAARAYLLTAAEELVRQGLGKETPDPATLRLAELHCLLDVVSS